MPKIAQPHHARGAQQRVVVRDVAVDDAVRVAVVHGAYERRKCDADDEQVLRAPDAAARHRRAHGMREGPQRARHDHVCLPLVDPAREDGHDVDVRRRQHRRGARGAHFDGDTLAGCTGKGARVHHALLAGAEACALVKHVPRARPMAHTNRPLLLRAERLHRGRNTCYSTEYKYMMPQPRLVKISSTTHDTLVVVPVT
jgi:hypothetical protein